jgi:tRNA(Arg) A34 adenosine deaminase TadA
MMRRCLQLSEQSAAAGERPFGALLAAGAVVVATAGNRVEMDRDLTRHAEVVALAEAQLSLGKKIYPSLRFIPLSSHARCVRSRSENAAFNE